jgi:hypothetical protein
LLFADRRRRVADFLNCHPYLIAGYAERLGPIFHLMRLIEIDLAAVRLSALFGLSITLSLDESATSPAAEGAYGGVL